MPLKKPELKGQDIMPEKPKSFTVTGAPEQAPQFEVEKTPQESAPRRDQAEKASPVRKSKKVSPAPAAPAPQPKAELLLEVEDILSEDLDAVYQKMTPENQRRFKAKGEEIARTVWQMIETAKLQLKKILTLLREWLKMIPGVNRYFLEQETKIKIDKIIELAHKQKK